MTGVAPNTKVCDLGAATKGQARKALRDQYLVKLRKNPSRLSLLSEEFDNLPMVSLRLGYNPELFSPRLRSGYDRMKAQSGSTFSAGAALASEPRVAALSRLMMTDGVAPMQMKAIGSIMR